MKRRGFALLVLFGLLVSLVGTGGAGKRITGAPGASGDHMARYSFNDGDTWESCIEMPEYPMTFDKKRAMMIV